MHRKGSERKRELSALIYLPDKMEERKEKALINWVNALIPNGQVSRLLDLANGQVFVNLLKLSEKCETATSVPECYVKVQEYIEEHYFTKLEPGSSVIDISLIVNSSLHSDSLLVEWELAKVLYALLGAFVQDKMKQTFIDAALTLSQEEQMDIMQLLEPMVTSQDLTNRLPADFADILKRKRELESTFHKDADLFFKLVTQGKGIVTSTPTVDQSFNFPTVFNGTPLTPVPSLMAGSARATGPHEISSPMRMLTLASPGPVTPLSALMQSPQVAQKMLLRQKEKEIRKLEIVVASERHFRDNLELDLKEKCELLGQKELKVQELETALKGQRNIADVCDELELVKQERDHLQKEISSAQLRCSGLQDIKDHCKYLERENNEKITETKSLAAQLLALESLKESHKEYRNKCRHQTLQIAEMESLLEHCKTESKQTKQKVHELEESRVSLRQQLDEIKAEKAEMEEMMAFTAIDCHNKNGESMGMIMETRIKELEEQLGQLRETWTDPESSKHLEMELANNEESKRIFETKFMETHQSLLKKDGEIEQVQQALTSSEENMEKLKINLSEMTTKLTALQTESLTLRSNESELSTLLQTVSTEKQVVEEEVVDLQTQLSHAKTEIKLLTMEAEGQKQAIVVRRQTMAASVDLAKSEQKSIEQKLIQEQASWEEKFDCLQTQLGQQKEEATKVQGDLKAKLKASQSSLKQLEIRMENEMWVKDNCIKCLKEEMTSLKEEICETEMRLREEVNILKENKVTLEGQLNLKKAIHQSEVEQLKIEITNTKERARSEEDGLKDVIAELQDKSGEYKVELDRNRIECDSKVQGLEASAERQQAKWSERETGLKEQIAQQEELCTGLTQSLQEMEAEVTTLKEDLSQEASTRSDLERNLKGIEKELGKEKQLSCTLKKDIEAQQTVISDLKNSLSLATSELSHLTECLDEQHMQISKVSETKVCLEQKLKNSETEFTKSQQANADKVLCLNEELEKFRSESTEKETTLTKDLAKSRKECEGVHKQLDQLKEQFQVSVHKGSSLDSRLDDLTRQIQTRNDENEALTREVSHLQEQVDELTGQVVLVTKVAETKQVSNDQLTQENGKLSDEVQQLSARIDQIVTEHVSSSQEKSDAISSLEASLTAKDNAVSNLKNDNAELKSQSSEFTQKVSELEMVVSDKDSEISSLSECISERDVVISNLTGDKQDLILQVAGLETEKDTLQKLCDVNCEQVSCLDKQLCDLNIKTQSQQEMLNVRSDEISSLELLVLHHTQEKESIKKQNDVNHDEICSLNKQLAEKTQDIDKLQIKCEQLTSESQIKRCELDKALEDNGVLTEKLESVSTKHQTSIRELNSELEKALSDKDTLNEKFASVTTKYETSIGKLRSEQEKASSDSDVWAEKMNVATGKYETSISELRSELDKALSDNDSLTEKLASVTTKYETSIGELRSEQEKASSDSDVWAEKMNVATGKYETSISELRSELNKALSDNDSLTEKLVSLTTKYETIISELRSEQEKASSDSEVLAEKLVSVTAKYEKSVSELRCKLEKASSEKDVLAANLESTTAQYQISIAEMKDQMKSDCNAFVKSHEDKMRDFVKEMTSTNQELKQAGEKRRSLEQTILELNQRLTIQLDNKDRVILEAKVAQVESELNQKSQILEQVRTSCHQTMEESEQYWRSQLAQLENEYHKATEEQTQQYRDQLTSQEQSFQTRCQALVQEKEMIAVSQKAALQDRIAHMEKKLEKKQTEIENLEKKHKTESSAISEKLKSNNQVQIDKIQDLLTSETESQKELANKLHSQQARCDELEKALRERKQSYDISMANQTENHNEEQNNLRLEFKTKLSELQMESRQLLEQEQSRTVAANGQCTELHNKLDEATKEITSYRRQIENMKENAELSLQQWQLKVAEVKGTREAEEAELRTELSRIQDQCSDANAEKSQLNDKIRELEDKESKLQQTIDNYRVHYNKKKEVIDLLKKEVEVNLKVGKEFQTKSIDLSQEVKKLKALLQTEKTQQHGLQDKLDKEKVNNKTLSIQMVELKAELKATKKQVETLRTQLEITGTHYIGDNSDFVQTCLNHKDDDTLSERRSSSSPEMAPRRRSSRNRLTSMDQSMISTDSGRSVASLPRGTAKLFAMEDEPADLEWKRFSELQRRNTLMLPHMRSTYPVEMQQYAENSVRESLAFTNSGTQGSGRKRKQESSSDEGESSKQQSRHSTVYHKPGPPTPGNSNNLRRNSKGTPRYNLRSSPRTPIGNSRSKRTPKRSVNDENVPSSLRKSAKKWLSNAAFTIVNTPNKKFRGHTGSVSSATKSASKGSRKPLGNKNFLQTGV
ncbi:nuclear mitotic apparatus protein 1-like isoform X1 [Mizuhopecten yessoensis]|uniref:Nuclear mitotic apparatus protein 1 n=1 Tax=Mizuhopecten yessoensis TaxID=6573 RepID=A0A210QXS6_MIZYE|nr:nuclear mitotic apparatus protein 1-like isoform X1 [Mizuhopecten yessoensis]OWF53540.1 Nuclear mitotic apparatus protein 1 [Mizuhopecten yessoensis]